TRAVHGGPAVHLTALVESPDHVCCRYRLSAFRGFLEHAGHILELTPFPKGPWAWFRFARQLPPNGCVIVQRKLLKAWQLYLLRQRGQKLIYDFDDAIFLRDSYAGRGLDDPRRESGFRRMARAADAVVAGNEHLREQALRAGAGALTSVIPTCVAA